MSRLRRWAALRGGILVRLRRRLNGRVLVFALCALPIYLA